MLQVAFGRHAKVHALRVLLPPRPPADSAGEPRDSFRLVFGAGAAEVGSEAGGLKAPVSAPPGGGAGGKKKKKKKRRREGEEEGAQVGVEAKS